MVGRDAFYLGVVVVAAWTERRDNLAVALTRSALLRLPSPPSCMPVCCYYGDALVPATASHGAANHRLPYAIG
ncbi:hypothetical protein NPIL_329241 [Nephila pilipes]|uniref:Uncharacterized protein n=1 Tax=Nephila pilipes TaxID=299642 RepID=A0A8X6UG97_NEPPI|nr:hypothetical protein NPIL_329241 [Nephila pilipes]